jgi:hypothetical protein
VFPGEADDIWPTETSKLHVVGCLRAEDIVEEFPVVNVDSLALYLVRLSPAALKR